MDSMPAENKKNIKRKIIVFLFLLICVIILLFVTFKTDYFHIKKIVVENNVFVSKQEVISLSQLTDKNIFLINKNSTERGIKLNPYIKDISLKRKLPSTVVIDVNEKKIRGVIKFKGGLINVDSDGKMVQIVDKFPKGKIPLILNTGIQNYKPNQCIYKENSNELQALIAALTISDYNQSRYCFKSIDVKDPFNIVLCTNSGKVIKIGNWLDMSHKLAFVMSLLKRPDVKGLKGFIQLQSDGTAVIKKN